MSLICIKEKQQQMNFLVEKISNFDLKTVEENQLTSEFENVSFHSILTMDIRRQLSDQNSQLSSLEIFVKLINGKNENRTFQTLNFIQNLTFTLNKTQGLKVKPTLAGPSKKI